ncbi:MAG TPA: hypothetical protein VF054_14260 [Micromonosporaceae bacterium]
MDNLTRTIVVVGAGVATTYLTAKLMKELRLPAYAAPVVGTVVGHVVNNAVHRLS